MIVVALPLIARDLGADAAASTWLITSYLITMASRQPIAGRLGDRLRRTVPIPRGQASTQVRSGSCRRGISPRALSGPQVALEREHRHEDREHQRQLAPATPFDRGPHDHEHEEQSQERSGDEDEGTRRPRPHCAEGGSGSVAPSRFGLRPDRRRFTQTSGS